jgi:serine/threonine protein kinase
MHGIYEYKLSGSAATVGAPKKNPNNNPNNTYMGMDADAGTGVGAGVGGLHLVMELAEVDLFDHVEMNGRLVEREARDIFVGLLRALKYLHRRGIVHRDVKPGILAVSAVQFGTLQYSICNVYCTVQSW